MNKEELNRHDHVRELLERRDFGKLRDLISGLYPADAEELFEEMSEKERLIVFRLLPKDEAAEIFVEMQPEMQQSLINSFTDRELSEVLDELYVDDAADIVGEMPAAVVTRMLKAADPKTRYEINRILRYPQDSAGSVMTTEFVKLRESMTISQAFEKIRRVGPDSETVYTCYVTDSSLLIGVITVKAMLLAPEGSTVSELMERDVISIGTHDDKEKAVELMSKYDLLALPVVDAENRLVGIVTIDDAIDVLREEMTEDIEKMAAIATTDKPYLKTSVVSTWLKRMPWLAFLMISATFTGTIIASYENALANAVILTAFIPMLMDTGGNAGSQVSVTVIRGLSLGEITLRDIFSVMRKEFCVSLLCGGSLALLGFAKLILIDHTGINVAATVAITLLAAVIFAKLIGCVLPIIVKSVGLDPALVSSPLITTIADAVSLMIYFRVATVLIPNF